jgi:plasmid stability protein
MARKQTPAPKQSEPDDDDGTMLVRLELPKSTHQDFRVEAAKEGRSMANMARRLVEEWLAKRKAAK